MQKFHVHSAVVFLVTLGFAVLSSLLLYSQSAVIDRLLPREQSVYPWDAVLTTDASRGGSSEITLHDASSSFSFGFMLSESTEYPYIAYSVDLTPHSLPVALADWTQYDTFKFNILCSNRNILTFSIHTFDDEVTKLDDHGSYRVAETFFACSEERREVTIDLKELVTPEWWFRRHGVDYSKQSYRLDKVVRFSLHNSAQSPRNTHTMIEVTSAFLQGTDQRYIFAAAGFNLLIWSAYIYWYLRRRTSALVVQITEKVQQERPLIAYQQLPDDTKHDRLRNTILQYMAAHYADQDLNLDMVAADLGTNRARINACLKEESGLTFTAYINKLRLTEAARLLLHKETSIAEIADEVGYSNASYFTTVFKKEYACTPGEFRRLMVDKKRNNSE